MIDESRFRQVLRLEGLQRYLGVQDQYTAYTTTKAIGEETKTGFLNDLFQKAMRTGSYKDFSAVHLQDLKVSVFKELRSKAKNTIRNLMDRVLKKEPRTRESLIEKLENISKYTFEGVFRVRVPRYKLDQVFAYLQNKAKKENKKLPQFIVDSFIKRSILGPSIDSKLVEDSFVKNIKEAIDTVIKNWELMNDQEKKDTIERFEPLLGEVFRYTDFEATRIIKRGTFSEALKNLILEMKPYVADLLTEAADCTKDVNVQNIVTASVDSTRVKTRKREINLLKETGFILGDLSKNERDLVLDREEYLALLRENGEILRKIPYEQHDREIVLTAIRNSAWAILYTTSQFNDDKEMIAAALQSCKRLFIIPLFRTFIPMSRKRKSGFAHDVYTVKFLYIENFIRTMRYLFRTVTFDTIKETVLQFFVHHVRLSKRHAIDAMRAFLEIFQGLYRAVFRSLHHISDHLLLKYRRISNDMGYLLDLNRKALQQFLQRITLMFLKVFQGLYRVVLRNLYHISDHLLLKCRRISNGMKYLLDLNRRSLQQLLQKIRRISFTLMRAFT